MLIIFACAWSLSPLFPEDSELLYIGSRCQHHPSRLLPSVDSYYNVPGLKTACHSLSLFCTGCDILRFSAVENRAPRKGIVGIDFRGSAGRASDANGFGGVLRTLAKRSDRRMGKVKRIKVVVYVREMFGGDVQGAGALVAAATFMFAESTMPYVIDIEC